MRCHTNAGADFKAKAKANDKYNYKFRVVEKKTNWLLLAPSLEPSIVDSGSLFVFVSVSVSASVSVSVSIC